MTSTPIIELIKLTGYGIKKDMRTNQVIIT